MKPHSYFFTVKLPLLLLLLASCASGPAEEPLPDAIESPLNLLNRGIIQYNNDNYPQAIDTFEKALLQYRSIDDQAGIAKSCMNIAKSLMAMNNNQLAEKYLDKAQLIIEQSALDELQHHLHLLNSSLAINNARYERALQELTPTLASTDTTMLLAALKNRTRIAFITDDTNKQQWLEEYKSLQQSHPEDTSSHLARILRFEAELQTETQQKEKLLSQSLMLSKKLANRPAIAATLVQWADNDAGMKNFTAAEDKYLRALFIRHQLNDVQNTRHILEKLQAVYQLSGDEKQTISERWINNITGNELKNWPQLISDFETYPQIK